MSLKQYLVSGAVMFVGLVVLRLSPELGMPRELMLVLAAIAGLVSIIAAVFFFVPLFREILR